MPSQTIRNIYLAVNYSRTVAYNVKSVRWRRVSNCEHEIRPIHPNLLVDSETAFSVIIANNAVDDPNFLAGISEISKK